MLTYALTNMHPLKTKWRVSKRRIALTLMNRTGSVERTASTKKSEITLGGLRASGRKMWLISSFLPYRTGFSYLGGGTLGSSLMSTSKTGVSRPCAEPNEAMTTEPLSGLEERSS